MSLLLRALKVTGEWAVAAAVAGIVAYYVVERDRLRPGDDDDDDCNHCESRPASTGAGGAFHDHLLREDPRPKP